MKMHRYRSVWDAIADSPEEAAHLKLRAQLMDAIKAYLAHESITQAEAAHRLGVPRSRVSELVNDRISKFTIDKLVNMAARVGLSTQITVKEDQPRSVSSPSGFSATNSDPS
jgi:predicted XRE-type DNA-binding protein